MMEVFQKYCKSSVFCSGHFNFVIPWPVTDSSFMAFYIRKRPVLHVILDLKYIFIDVFTTFNICEMIIVANMAKIKH